MSDCQFSSDLCSSSPSSHSTPPAPAHCGALASASSAQRFVDVCWNQNHVHGAPPLPRRAHPYFQRWMVKAEQGRRLAGVDQAHTSFRRGFPPPLLFCSSFFQPFYMFISATFRRSCLTFVSVRSDSLAVFSHTFAYQCCFGLSCRGKRRS